MEEKLKEIFTDILDIEENLLTDDLGPADSPLWDSMNNLRLITAIEEEFKIQFSMEEIETMIDFGKVKEALNRHI
jgi:acyl carrier protein